MVPEQTNDGVDSNVNRATRLLRTFAILTESLRAHRDGGKQTVTLRRYGRVIHLYSPEVLQVRNSI